MLSGELTNARAGRASKSRYPECHDLGLLEWKQSSNSKCHGEDTRKWL